MVMLDEGKVALAHQDVTLGFDFLLTVSLGNPLLFEHGAFDSNVGAVLILNGFLGGLLPVEDSKSVCVELGLFFGFSDLTFEFLLCVERVKLGINLLLKHALLDLTALVN